MILFFFESKDNKGNILLIFSILSAVDVALLDLH